MMPFFQPDWAGACRGCWAGNGAAIGTRAAVGLVCRLWIVGSDIGLLIGWFAGSGCDTAGLQSLDTALLCKDKKVSKGR